MNEIKQTNELINVFFTTISSLKHIEKTENVKLIIPKNDKKFIKVLFYTNKLDKYFLFTDFLNLVIRQSIEFEQSPLTVTCNLCKGLKKEMNN